MVGSHIPDVGLHRRVWEDEEGDHAQIEVHGIEDPEAATLRRRLAQRLRAFDQVRWAEGNAITGTMSASAARRPWRPA